MGANVERCSIGYSPKREETLGRFVLSLSTFHISYVSIEEVRSLRIIPSDPRIQLDSFTVLLLRSSHVRHLGSMYPVDGLISFCTLSLQQDLCSLGLGARLATSCRSSHDDYRLGVGKKYNEVALGLVALYDI